MSMLNTKGVVQLIAEVVPRVHTVNDAYQDHGQSCGKGNITQPVDRLTFSGANFSKRQICPDSYYQADGNIKNEYPAPSQLGQKPTHQDAQKRAGDAGYMV